MKKNRLLLLLNVSMLAVTPAIYSQDAPEVVENEGGVTKQQLEQFLSEKPAEAGSTEESSSAGKEDSQAKTEIESEKQDSAKTEKKEDAPASESPSAGTTTDTTQEAKEKTSEEKKALEAKTESADNQLQETELPASPAPAAEVVQDLPKVASGLPEKTEETKVEQKSLAEALEPVAQETPAQPATTAEAKVATPVAQPQESLLDTIDIEEGGNWVLKRKALQDTVRKIEDINALYDDIRDTNIVFLQGINTVDVLFTQFSYDVGLDLGKVDQLVQDVSHHLESEREETGDLSQAERDILQKTEDRKKEIEQLRSNIHDIWQAHAQLKEARTLNDDQIIEADRIRKQAWRNFRMIERVLNEVKAEELYHETVQLFEALQTSYRYLQTRLIPHFEQSIKTIQDKMQSVKKQAEDLQSQGVLLKQQAIQVDRMEKEGIEESQEISSPTTGWLGTIKNLLMAPFNALGSLWAWLTGSSNDMSKFLPDTDAEQEVHEAKHPEEV